MRNYRNHISRQTGERSKYGRLRGIKERQREKETESKKSCENNRTNIQGELEEEADIIEARN